MSRPSVVILGAGPAGLASAFRLATEHVADVTVLEANGWVGGSAASFEIEGVRVDYGSHRLHPSCDPTVLKDIRALLGDDLLDRPRHGRIRLRSRWIHFPLKPADLALRLPPGFALGALADLAGKPFRRRELREQESFASVLRSGLGDTICREFYFPYARKLWGLDPESLSATQARRRVSAGSVGKMLRKVLSATPGRRPAGGGHFFYPRHGYGQICEAYHRAAGSAGADIRLNARVLAVEAQGGSVHGVRYVTAGQEQRIGADFVWSTMPITSLARSLDPGVPRDCLSAADSIRYRAMILIYLVLDQARFSEYDAHYFPGLDLPISRLSEPRNYVGDPSTDGPTVLCAELPCAADGPEWNASDEELGQVVRDALAVAGIPAKAGIRQVVTRRLRNAYPIYHLDYEEHLGVLEESIGRIDGLLSFGRLGLFAHDNTHHALLMGYSAASCLTKDGRFDGERWQAYRRAFQNHVVED